MGFINEEEAKIEDICKLLKSGEVHYHEIELTMAEEQKVRILMKDEGIRNIVKSGYDVLSNTFYAVDCFVYVGLYGEESYNRQYEFSSFAQYHNFLKNDIYINSNFYQLDVKKHRIPKSVNVDKLLLNDNIGYTIDNYTSKISKEELNLFNLGKMNKKLYQKSRRKLNESKSVNEFVKNLKSLYNSKVQTIAEPDFYLNHFLNDDDGSFVRLDTVMEFLSYYWYHDIKLLEQLVYIFGGEAIVSRYDYNGNAKSTNSRKKSELRKFAKNYDVAQKKRMTKYLFNITLNCYEKHEFITDIVTENYIGTQVSYLNSIEEVLQDTNGSLENVNASNDYELKLNVDEFEIFETTILPIHLAEEVQYTLKKYFSQDTFYVEQIWLDSNKNIIKEYKHSFDYFSEFCQFLNFDISNADLVECNGLENLIKLSQLNFKNAKVSSKAAKFLGLKIERIKLDLDQEFTELINNETHAITNVKHRDSVSKLDENLKQNVINYISDIHLMHKFIENGCQTDNDVDNVIVNIINDMLKTIKWNSVNFLENPVIVINGDTSSKFEYFERFVSTLRKKLNQGYRNIDVIFTLGNHELWDFSNCSLNEITKEYREVIELNGMYLLQNEILYRKGDLNSLDKITESELETLSSSELRQIVDGCSVVFFGGIGFSGLNEEFNANSGIYRKTINREVEIKQSKNFEELYTRVSTSLIDKNLLIITHMPISSWTEKPIYSENYVYITGHSHRKEFIDDGIHRVYADNQAGYKAKKVKLRHLLMNGNYELFTDLDDGVHCITIEQYNEYLRSKSIRGKVGETIYRLYMIKREKYFCFISESKSKSLCILNGGSKKRLEVNDINYVYNNMMRVIQTIEKPLFQYKNYQTQISNAVKQFGGDGRIHGSIIDIDYYSHIHVDPLSGLITPYFASNIKNKLVYPSIELLLKDNNKAIYNKYKKLLSDNRLPVMINELETTVNEIEFNSDTSMYKASNEIMKMQKLQNKTLTTWVEVPTKSPKLI